MISEPSTSSQPKGISQAPPPIDAPYVEFDLLTGDIHGAPAANGFSPQVDWNIFRFHRIPGDKAVVDAFAFPIKLNRKNFKYREAMEVDEEEPLGPNDGDPSTSGATEASGLLQGLDLQELKNVVVPASASQIGQSVKMETPGAGSSGAKKNEKLVPLKGPDGQVVIGSNGQPVMVTPAIAAQAKGGRLPYIPGVTAEPKGKKGKVAQRGPGGAPGAAGKPGEGKPGEGRKRGGKKTRQVFLIPEHTRKLRKEERFPWLWEDSSGKEVWEGRRVERNKVKMQLLQVCRDGTFRWYPARKHYMFTKLPTWTVLGAEEANEQFEKEQKRKNPLYFAQNTPYTSISRAFAHQARLEDMDQKKASTFGGEATVTRSQNLFRLVDRGRPVSSFEKDEDDFEAGDEETKKFKQEREQELFGMEGDMDEMEFEEEIADDDERVHADGNEEEEKEQEERLKREWRQANKTNAEVDDYAITGRPIRLDKAGKRMKKILRGQDKSGTLYESDSDKDPYASQEESDSESDLEEKERIEKEKAEKEKAEKAKKEEEEQLKQLLEEKEKEREAEKEKEKEKEKKGKGPAKPETPVPNKAVAALSGKSMPTSGKNSAVQSRGGSPKPNAGGNMSRQVSPGLSTAAPARASSPSGSKPMGITSHSRSPSASGTSTPVVEAEDCKSS
ncbi:hypothetical protein FRC18_006474 [Serendipita sp. 400]|nr:hypothetical protein FRC18_006474 [Serendipita sp. 400]